MQILNDVVGSVGLVQMQFFGIAAILSVALFWAGYALGRSTKGKTVNVPLEVLYALASPKNGGPATFASGKDSVVAHEIEVLADDIEHHDKDFAHAQAHALKGIDKIIHDHGASKDLTDLRHKVEHAHTKEEVEHALHDFVAHHH